MEQTFKKGVNQAWRNHVVVVTFCNSIPKVAPIVATLGSVTEFRWNSL